MATFDSNMFFYHRDTNLMTVDMSQLDNGGTRRVWEQIYPDAADDGIRVVSHRTGIEIEFVVDKVDGGDEEHDGEIMGWNLVPTAKSIRLHPRCKGVKMLIVNT